MVDSELNQAIANPLPKDESIKSFVFATDQSQTLKETYKANLNPEANLEDAKPILMLYKKLREIMRPNDHHLSPELIKQLPLALHEPAAIFLSKRQGENHQNLIIMSHQETKSKSQDAPIVIALHFDQLGGLNRSIPDEFKPSKTTQLASAYPKDNAKLVFDRWQQEGLLIYTDPKKIDLLEKYGIKLIEQEGLNINRSNELNRSDDLNRQTSSKDIER